MSLCRWSSDDFQCDVYCYESDRGYETHVAANRVVFSEPLPAPVAADDIEGWVTRHARVMAMVERAERVPIRGPFDGESYLDGDAASVADRLEMLREAGYVVPQYAIDALREEAPDGSE